MCSSPCGLQGEGDYKSPWAVPAVTFFLLVVLYVMLTELMRRKLVVEMRGADASPRAPDDRRNADYCLPPPPLRVEVSTTEEILGTFSRHQPPEAARARQVFDHSVAVHRAQVYFLVIVNLLIASTAVSLQQPYPLFGTPAVILIGAPLALSFVGMLGRRTSRLTILIRSRGSRCTPHGWSRRASSPAHIW